MGGQWTHCRDCGHAGDMISLAASYWKLDLSTAALWLTEKADQQSIDEHRRTTNHHSGAAALIESARRAGLVVINRYLQKLHLTIPTCEEHWLERLGRWCGVSHKKYVEMALRPGTKKWARGQYRIFVGLGWKDVFLVPFYDLPGRIRGMWIIGRNMVDQDTTFVPFPRKYKETGLAFLDTALGGPDPEFGDTVFVLDDVRTALKIHDKNFQQSSRPLPLLACCTRDRYFARFDSGVLNGKRLVFWGPRITRDLIRQAMAGDGLIWTSGRMLETHQHMISQFPPRVFLQHVLDNAVHWNIALEAFIADMPDTEVEETIRFLGIPYDQLRLFLSNTSKATRERVEKIVFGNKCRIINVGTRLVIEKNGRWHVSAGTCARPVLLSDAPFRIERVLQAQYRDKAFYQVAATFCDKTVRFVTPKKEFEENPLWCVKSKIEQAGLGWPKSAWLGWPWNHLALDVSTRLWQPELSHAPDRCGWNERLAAWVFDKFSITARGEVSEDLTFIYPDRSFPTRTLLPPAELHPDDITLLSRTDKTAKVVWASVACVLANLIAPVSNRDTSGAALVGKGAASIGRATAQLLGCDKLKPLRNPTSTKRKNIRTLVEREKAHGWPLILNREDSLCDHLVHSWLSQPGPRNALIDLDWYTARIIWLHGGWHIIECDTPLTLSAHYRRGLPMIVPAFLKWYGEKGLVLPKSDTFGDSVLGALEDWFTGIGGDPAAVKGARDVVTFDHGCCPAAITDCFAAILCRLHKDGSLNFGAANQEKILLLPYTEDGNLFVPKDALNELLAEKGAPILDTLVVTKALAEEGVLVREIDYGEPPQSGWEISRDWWNRKQRL